MSQTHLFNTDGVACYLTTIGDTGLAGVTGMAGILMVTRVLTRASDTGVKTCSSAQSVTGAASVAGVNTCWLTAESGTGAAGLLTSTGLVSATVVGKIPAV